MKLFGLGGKSPPTNRGAYDRVEVTEDDGTVRKLDRSGFMAMALDARVRYILGKRLRFFSGSREVPTKEALVDG